MSGWAQRDAEAKEDREELIEQLRYERDLARDVASDRLKIIADLEEQIEKLTGWDAS